MILCILACVAKESSLVPSVFPIPWAILVKQLPIEMICNHRLIMSNASVHHQLVVVLFFFFVFIKGMKVFLYSLISFLLSLVALFRSSLIFPVFPYLLLLIFSSGSSSGSYSIHETWMEHLGSAPHFLDWLMFVHYTSYKCFPVTSFIINCIESVANMPWSMTKVLLVVFLVKIPLGSKFDNPAFPRFKFSFIDP